MGTWNNNNREESKPHWLTKLQKRFCVRTPRGWEIPLAGSPFAYGNTGATTGTEPATIFTEVVVALPNDPSTDGTISANYAYGPTGFAGVGRMDGLTFENGGTAANRQFAPYFTAPFHGDGGITGAFGFAQQTGSTGVSHGFIRYTPGFDSSGYPLPWGAPGATPPSNNLTGPGARRGYQYGVNSYGVSTLGGLTGVTAYIKVVANDTNLTQTLTLSLTAGSATGGLYLATGRGLTIGNSVNSYHIPYDVFNTFFGPTSDRYGNLLYRTDNIGVLIVAGGTASGTVTTTIRVQDNSASTSTFGSVTGASAATTFSLVFDRPAGLTTSGMGVGDGPTAPAYGSYFYTTTDTIRN